MLRYADQKQTADESLERPADDGYAARTARRFVSIIADRNDWPRMIAEHVQHVKNTATLPVTAK